ncbi:hypothetical protein DBV14_17605 [Variovorax sp. KBW07]|uniref:winged helix-turn-helix transcriptional regulator n=1 Tax=Variovorax sp. KBW07 TaxID=2153358 RepID=UPI000F570481|nr:response regulator transcription factor [Variovorax sp. KBW07]RQO50940.1 hypothetical protein DBV14_17605 [Variovorax sp. KBW07]
MPILAVVESNEARKNSLRSNLDSLGYASVGFERLSDFSQAMERNQCFDLLIHSVDDNEIRSPSVTWSSTKIPTLFLMNDKCWGLLPSLKDFGQEEKIDCLHSSFNIKELEYRVGALIVQTSSSLEMDADLIDFQRGAYRIETKKRVIRLNGQEILLKPREFDVALLLFHNAGRVLTRDKIWRSIVGRDLAKGSRSLDVCICNLRKKLKIGIENGVTLRMIYGEGYQLITESTPDVPAMNFMPQAHAAHLDVLTA